jgi:hypothetical protein
LVTNAIARTSTSATPTAAIASAIASIDIQMSRRSRPVGARPA